MTPTLKSCVTAAVIALACAASFGPPASAKDTYKGYSWNKFANDSGGQTSARKPGSRVASQTSGDSCSTYWTKWKNTGDNIWRGRWYACVYGGL